MIEAKALLIHNEDGSTTQRCVCQGVDCQEVCTVPQGKEPPIFPYVSVPCWRKGWRNRGKFGYAPGEVF